MAWGVFAPSQGTPMGAFAGEYVGASGDVSLGAPTCCLVVQTAPLHCSRSRWAGQAGINVFLRVSGLMLAFVL